MPTTALLHLLACEGRGAAPGSAPSRLWLSHPFPRRTPLREWRCRLHSCETGEVWKWSVLWQSMPAGTVQQGKEFLPFLASHPPFGPGLQGSRAGLQVIRKGRFLDKVTTWPGLPQWLSSEESTCQCRRLGFDPWVGTIPLEKERAIYCSILALEIPWTVHRAAE